LRRRIRRELLDAAPALQRAYRQEGAGFSHAPALRDDCRRRAQPHLLRGWFVLGRARPWLSVLIAGGSAWDAGTTQSRPEAGGSIMGGWMWRSRRDSG